MAVTIVVETRADAGTAFDFVSDPTNETTWNPAARRVDRVTDGPVAPGSTFNVIGKMAGREMAVRVTVEQLRRPHRVETRAQAASIAFHTSYDVDDTGAGTRVTMTVAVSVAGRLRPLSPIIRTGFARRLRRLQPRLQAALDELVTPNLPTI